jgi:hypothetical protein
MELAYLDNTIQNNNMVCVNGSNSYSHFFVKRFEHLAEIVYVEVGRDRLIKQLID